jgi:hypothetical protein
VDSPELVAESGFHARGILPRPYSAAARQAMSPISQWVLQPFWFKRLSIQLMKIMISEKPAMHANAPAMSSNLKPRYKL